MAFGVSGWPYSPDPRDGMFSAHGWAYGAVAPWAWVLSSPGAAGVYIDLLDGVIVKPVSDSNFFTEWRGFGNSETGTEYQFRKTSRPGAGDNEVSIDFALDAFNIAEPNAQGTFSAMWPYAIQVFGPVEMLSSPGGNPIPDLPNGISISPANWGIEYPL